MQNLPGRKRTDATGSLLGWLTIATLILAVLLTGIWLWSCWCSFPSIPWNDIRIAPAVALHHGISIYSPRDNGPVSTWIYGPLPLFLLWPAGLASTALGAIEIGGAIHIGFTVFGVTLICLLWPAETGKTPPTQNWPLRLAAAVICVLLVRSEAAGYLVYTADAPGVVLGLLSLLALSRGHPWTAAGCAAAAVACKLTLLGVGAAQVVWMLVRFSPRAAAQQLARCVVAGVMLAGPAVIFFGGPGLWHTMIELPGRFPWAPVLSARLGLYAGHLVLYVGMPLAVMIFWRRFFFSRESSLLLSSLAFLFLLPLGIAAILKIGGNVNSLDSFGLWLPPTLVVLVTGRTFARFGPAGRLALAASSAALASLWLQLTPLRMQPNTQAYREAMYLAARLPKKIWFPLHPLVTLYSDGRFYHDFDGLGERVLAGQRLTDEHYFAHMPAHRQVIATLLPIGWGPADTAEARIPKDTPVNRFGNWRLDGSPD
jgi:hypothetical protein